MLRRIVTPAVKPRAMPVVHACIKPPSMRTRSIALHSCLITGLSVHAQTAGIGFKGGILYSTVKVVNIQAAPIPGGTAGVYFPWGIGPRMELQPEVMASTLGATYTEPDGDAYTIRSLYLQVPVSIKLYIGNGFNFSGGYQFGKLMSARRTATDDQLDVTGSYEQLDMGFVGGLGMDFRNGLDLGLRAYSAMTPSLRDDDALFPKNRSVQLTVGYRFQQFRGVRQVRRRG